MSAPRPTPSQPPHGWGAETLLAVTLGASVVVGGLVWATAQLASLAFGAHTTVPLTAAGLAAAVWQLPQHVTDPAGAFPVRVRGLLPGPAGMYTALALVVAAVVGAGSALARAWPHERVAKADRKHSVRWAAGRKLRPLRVRSAGKAARQGRLVLGRAPRVGGGLLTAEGCHSVLVIGPPGSGKTSGLVIPAVLEWAGPVVTTSIKPDVLRATLARRGHLGEVWCYDPTGTSGVPGAQWTPLAGCRHYPAARKMARRLAATAGVSGLKAEDANYWNLLGAKLLAVLLYAAAASDRSMGDVVRWLDTQDQDDVTETLDELGDQWALDAWAACRARPENTLGSVYGTAETLLDCFGDPAVAASAQGCDLDIDALLSGANTLYLYAPTHEQQRLRPLFELLISTVIARAEELAAIRPDGLLDPRPLVALDEAGNCAALANLPELATTARGQGIQLLTCWHDEAQLAYRYGKRAATVLNGHRAKLWLSGQADLSSLKAASDLIGQEAYTDTTTSHNGDGSRHTTQATRWRRLVPPELFRQLPPGHGVLIYGHLPPARLRLRPWYASRQLRTLANPTPVAGKLPAPQHAARLELEAADGGVAP